MAETPSKRLREESHQEFDGYGANNSKRQKPYNNILNILDEEEEEEAEPSQEPSHELSQDLSAIFTTLQQELSPSTTTTFDFDSLPSTAAVEEAGQSHYQDPSAECGGGGEDDGSIKAVMRHLLEASDDELGIPNTRDDENNLASLNSGENFPSDNGLWELEDEAANYYTVLQAELFMQ